MNRGKNLLCVLWGLTFCTIATVSTSSAQLLVEEGQHESTFDGAFYQRARELPCYVAPNGEYLSLDCSEDAQRRRVESYTSALERWFRECYNLPSKPPGLIDPFQQERLRCVVLNDELERHWLRIATCARNQLCGTGK